MGDKTGWEREILAADRVSSDRFFCYVAFCETLLFLSSFTRLFIHAMWVIPGYDFMDGDVNINVNSTANFYNHVFRRYMYEFHVY